MVSRSIECRRSWVVAVSALAILSLAFGAPLIAAVALKPIAAGLGVPRSIPALAGSVAFLGSGLGGILMGWMAERVGPRRMSAFGVVMVAAGLAVASGGQVWQLLGGYGLLVGFLGMACLFAPLITLVSRWFDRRRGTALALVASGQYIAGVIWPNAMEYAIDAVGWQRTMQLYAVLVIVAALPLTLLLKAAPAPLTGPGAAPDPVAGMRVLGLRPNAAMALIASGIFLCCIPMAMPQGHLVALCSDLGMPASRGAAMLTLMLALAFAGRQFWGWVADAVGGLRTVLVGSACQALAVALFAATQDEASLFAVSALFGVGFSGLVPAYVLAVRDLFPNREAGWRVPVLLLAGQGGMAAGGWMAGAIYDHFLAYAPAFALGAAFNLANLVLIGALVLRLPGGFAGAARPRPPVPARL